MIGITPNTVSSWCRTLSLHREELVNKPSHQAALNIQNAQRMLNQTVAQVRAGFRLVERT
jgi:hypothetical protein